MGVGGWKALKIPGGFNDCGSFPYQFPLLEILDAQKLSKKTRNIQPYPYLSFLLRNSSFVLCHCKVPPTSPFDSEIPSEAAGWNSPE